LSKQQPRPLHKIADMADHNLLGLPLQAMALQ